MLLFQTDKETTAYLSPEGQTDSNSQSETSEDDLQNQQNLKPKTDGQSGDSATAADVSRTRVVITQGANKYVSVAKILDTSTGRVLNEFPLQSEETLKGLLLDQRL